MSFFPPRMDAELLEATVWSWDTDRPETGFTDPRAAVVSVDGGRWTDVDSNSEAGARHSYACRNSDDGEGGVFCVVGGSDRWVVGCWVGACELGVGGWVGWRVDGGCRHPTAPNMYVLLRDQAQARKLALARPPFP